MKKLPSIAYLKECFHQDGQHLYWKLRPRNHFETDQGWKTFNSKNAGNIAGCIEKSGHRVLTLDGQSWVAARIVFKMFYEVECQDLYVVHRNGDRSDNTPSNLVLEDKAVACACRKQPKVTRGIYWSFKSNKWIAKIGNAKTLRWSASFEELEDAIEAVRAMREQIYGTHYGIR